MIVQDKKGNEIKLNDRFMYNAGKTGMVKGSRREVKGVDSFVWDDGVVHPVEDFYSPEDSKDFELISKG